MLLLFPLWADCVTIVVMKPIVLLDVDGVINDLWALAHRNNLPADEYEVFQAGVYTIFMPVYMPALIQHLVHVAEVHWCTTWRDRANDEIRKRLGIPPLPVITDESGHRDAWWKPAAAQAVVETALGEGREVFWIEDFDGAYQKGVMWDQVKFIDTALTRYRLDPRLLDGTVLEYGIRVEGGSH